MSKRLRKLTAMCMLALLVTQSSPIVYGADSTTAKSSPICAIKETEQTERTQEETQKDIINKAFTEAKDTLKKKVTIKVKKVDKEELERYLIEGPLVPYIRSAVLTPVSDDTIEAEIEYTTWYQAIKAYREPKLYQKQISETAIKTLAKAKQIIKELKLDKEKSAVVKEKAIHDYLISKGKYSEVMSGDIGNPMHGAEGLILNNDGMCRSYAESMQLFMELLGVESKLVMGWSLKGYEKHVWNMVKLDDGEWYYVDLTWDEAIPDEPGAVRYDYFNIPHRILVIDHELEEWQEPEPTMASTYFLYNDIAAYCSEDVVDVVKGQLKAGKKEREIYVAYGTNLDNLVQLILRAMEETETYGKVRLDRKTEKIYCYSIYE